MEKKGFTLLELLVVVAIIGLFATIVFTSMNRIREKTRDTRRDLDIKNIQTALEVYYLENGAYPIASWTSSNDDTAWSNLETQLGVQLPVDPLNILNTLNPPFAVGSNNYVYSYFGTGYGCSGQWYMIVSQREGDSNPPPSTSVDSCAGTFNYTGYGAITVGMNNTI